MDLKTVAILVFLTISIISNIAVYFALVKKSKETSDEAKLRAYFMLLDTKMDKVREKLEEISQDIEDIGIREDVKSDELSTYVRNKMPVKDIAKKMNKSIKEVELMMKMRGL